MRHFEFLTNYLSHPPQDSPGEFLSAMQALLSVPESPLRSPLFFSAVDQAPMAISITDLQARILYANPEFERTTGWSLEELVGSNQSMLSDKQTPASVYDELWSTILAGKVWQGRLINRHKGGQSYLAEVTVTPVVGADNEITHFLGMHRDVTQLHQMHTSSNNQRLLIESVIDSAPVMMVLLDDQQKLLLDNHEYKKLAGVFGQREAAQVLIQVLEQHLGQPYSQWGTALGTLRDQEVQCVDQHGNQRWFQCSLSSFEQEDVNVGSFFAQQHQSYRLLLAREVTQMKVEQERTRRSRLQAEMTEVERIHGIRETLNGAVFSLRGPINMISAALAMLKRGRTSDTQGIAHALDDAIQAGQAAVENLEACIPGHIKEPITPINMNELLRDVVTVMTQPLLAAGVMVDWPVERVLPAVLGRTNQVRHLFKQLVENAIDAMNERGRVERVLTMRTLPKGEMLHIVIDDTGPGVPSEMINKVFEPFYTTKGRQGSGAGMGLAMARDIVNQHNGFLELQKSPAGGCRVVVKLPVEQGTRGMF